MGFKMNGGSYDHKALLQVALSLLACNCIFTAIAVAGQSQSDCDRNCGNFIIQYPFGTSKSCSRDENFVLTCDKKSGSLASEKIFPGHNIRILDINLHGELRITAPVIRNCFKSSNTTTSDTTFVKFSPFTVSSTKNRFTVVGCDTNVKVSEFSSDGERFSTGCTLVCTNFNDVKNGSCSGIGCCQTSFPKDVGDYNINMLSFRNHPNVSSFNPCSYAFVVEDGIFDFSTKDLEDLREKTEFPMILSWAIERKTCKEAEKDKRTYECKENSVCEASESGFGYLCRCKDGYKGNPYLHETKGGCRKGRNNVALPLAAVGAMLGLAALSHSFNWVPQQKTVQVLKSEFIQQNLGEMLQDQISQLGGNSQGPTIYLPDQIETFTNYYDASRIIGRGIMGIVYRGTLPDKTTVAIKRSSKRGRPRQANSFVRELLALAQINHDNVAQLLGCCLDTEFPMLIYEFVKSVSPLFNAINATKKEGENESCLTWEKRLKIAAETADAISCLHSVSIVHGNIKSSNILLEENHRAKLTDCGALGLIPLEEDENQVSPFVRATSGYLDPEYLHRGQLNEKSDVYSLGIVVIELLTGRKAVEFSWAQQETTLVMHFVSAMNRNHLMGVIDRRIMNRRNEKELRQVALLARRCVSLTGKERPTMKEVATELQSLVIIDENNPPVGEDESAVAEITGIIPDVSVITQDLTGEYVDKDGEDDNLV